jgi:UDP-N-acetylglucosamine--N-acetylmuramyl-(pentapeptide) pyrophosphoryl-undecaprenol N-acetylglucosamine transferase
MTLVLLATGGTGGHIYPALALARLLVARGYEVAFIGHRGGIEAKLVPDEGFAFWGVRAGKLDRSRPDPRQGVRAALGLRDALAVVRHLRPALLVGFGGFAAFPGLAAARFLGVPWALHEQNAYPGLVTRLFARGARFIGVAQPGVAAHLPRAARARVVEVGMPVREQRLPKREARRRLGLPEAATLTLVLGGSQGSMLLNRAVPEAFAQLGPESAETHWILHSSGAAHLETVQTHLRACLTPSQRERYRVAPYLDTVLAWSAADLGVTRAGTGTLAEAALHGVPLLMVPLGAAADNHQLHNARAVERARAGTVIEERDLHPATLAAAWRRLLEPEARARASAAAQSRSPAGAAARLCERVVQELHLPRAPGLPSPPGEQETA